MADLSFNSGTMFGIHIRTLCMQLTICTEWEGKCVCVGGRRQPIFYVHFDCPGDSHEVIVMRCICVHYVCRWVFVLCITAVPTGMN